MFDLSDRRALVTGASGGIGGAIARQLHVQGAHVVLSGRRQEALDALAGELGGRATTLAADLGSEGGVDALVDDAGQDGIDILINNAGLTRDNLAMRMKDEDWQTVLDVNLTACFRLTRGLLRGMMKKRFGRVINITSIVAVTGNPGQANYAAAKAGMIGMSKALAAEVASPRHHGQLHRARLHRDRDDRCAERRAENPASRPDSERPARPRRGHRGGRRLSRQRRGRLRHRANFACQRRHGDDLSL